MSLKKAIQAIGRRKSSTARVYMTPVDAGAETEFVVNEKAFQAYFPQPSLRRAVLKPFNTTDTKGKYNIFVRVNGGGTSGQAGALSLGIARALQKIQPELHQMLRKSGLLTRDSREVERKKPGKHKARKSTQFSKR